MMKNPEEATLSIKCINSIVSYNYYLFIILRSIKKKNVGTRVSVYVFFTQRRVRYVTGFNVEMIQTDTTSRLSDYDERSGSDYTTVLFL